MRLPGLQEVRHDGWLAWVAVTLVGVLAPVLMVFATRSIATVLLAGFAMSGAALATKMSSVSRSHIVPRGWSRPLLPVLLLAVWIVLSLLWASDRPAAGDVLGQMLLVFALGALGLFALPRIAPRQAYALQAFGLCLTTVIILFEFAVDFPIRRSLSGPDAAALPGSQLNRAVVVLVLLLWPTAAGLLGVGHRRGAALLGVVCAAAVIIADSQAAQLGLILGLTTLTLAWSFPRSMPLVLAAAMGIVVLAMPITVTELDAILPASLFDLLSKANALHRLEIWKAYAALIPDNWIGGLGINASHALSQSPAVSQLSPAVIESLANRHPHNMALQVWVELGAVGAFLLAAVLASLAISAGRLTQGRAPWALAAIACGFAIASVGHGAWQTWWLALLVAVAVWFRMPIPRPGVTAARLPS